MCQRVLLIIFSFALFCSLPVYATEPCRSKKAEDFATFFTKFSIEKQFSLSRVIFPLQNFKWEYGTNEKLEDLSSATKTLISRKQYEAWQTLAEAIKTDNLESHIENTNSQYIRVRFTVHASDWFDDTYHFMRKGKCWYLYTIEDRAVN
jgi:hypothetical protein